MTDHDEEFSASGEVYLSGSFLTRNMNVNMAAGYSGRVIIRLKGFVTIQNPSVGNTTSIRSQYKSDRPAG